MILTPLQITPLSAKVVDSGRITIESLNPTLWLEDEASYMAFSSGSLVQRWNDVRGNGTYVENLDPARQPEHLGDGLGYLQSSGSNETPINLHYRTMYFADQIRTSWSDGVQSELTLQQAPDSTLLNDFNIYSHELDLGGQEHRVNRELKPVYQNSRTNRAEINFTAGALQISLGGSDSEIKAVIMFNKSLTLDEQDVVWEYLSNKYSITLQAPLTKVNAIASVGDSTARGNGNSINLPAEYKGTQTNVYICDSASQSIETYISTGVGVNNMQPSNPNPYASFTDSLGKHYIDRVGGSIIQVKHGVGGSTLGGSNVGSNYTLTDWDGLTNNFLGYIRACNNYLELNNSKRLNVLASVLALGDNDAANSTDASNFGTNLQSFIGRLKTCLPNNDFKIFLRRPVNTNPGSFLNDVRNAIDSYSGATVFNTDDLTTLDGIHLNETSDATLGERFADAI